MNERREGAIELQIAAEGDLVQARIAVRDRAASLQLSLAGQTRLLTAVTELARNALVHAGGGVLAVATLYRERRVGVEVVVSDAGPGMADPKRALSDPHGRGCALEPGLDGAKRLVDEFVLESVEGNGTRVALVCWRSWE